MLIESAKQHNISFVYALSPGLDIVYSNPDDVAALKMKLDQVSDETEDVAGHRFHWSVWQRGMFLVLHERKGFLHLVASQVKLMRTMKKQNGLMRTMLLQLM